MEDKFKEQHEVSSNTIYEILCSWCSGWYEHITFLIFTPQPLINMESFCLGIISTKYRRLTICHVVHTPSYCPVGSLKSISRGRFEKSYWYNYNGTEGVESFCMFSDPERKMTSPSIYCYLSAIENWVPKAASCGKACGSWCGPECSSSIIQEIESSISAGIHESSYAIRTAMAALRFAAYIHLHHFTADLLPLTHIKDLSKRAPRQLGKNRIHSLIAVP